MQTYWLLSVIERAASLDPEKIIKTLGRGYLSGRDGYGYENEALRS